MAGPHDYWSSTLPPSRGQWEQIARLACQLLDIEEPASRLDATVAAARLTAAVDGQDDGPPREARPASTVAELDRAIGVHGARHPPFGHGR